MTIIYCIITVLVVYYLALWGWYRHADNKTENSAGNETLPENEDSAGYTLIGESRYKGGQINPQPDKAGHLPQAAENDTQAAGTLARIEGTNLYDAVVENINGGLARVAELLKRNEAELAPAAVPTAAADTGKEYGTFDMNEYL